MNERKNPFQIGAQVVFLPDARTIGWHQHSFDRWRLYPGDTGTISEIVDGQYVIVDQKKDAALHWSQFRPSDTVSQADIDVARIRKDDAP